MTIEHTMKIESHPIAFTRITNDANGNPRYVCNFLYLDVIGPEKGMLLTNRYAIACKLANSIGGRKYHTKRYGRGIVFQSYALPELVAAISKITGKPYTGFSAER